MGMAKGEGGANAAAEAAIRSPLLETTIEGARGVLLNITGGKDLTLIDVTEACNTIANAVDPDAMIIFGAAIDETLDDEIRVTVIATGFGAKNPVLPKESNSKKGYDGLYSPAKKESGSTLGSFTPPSTEIPPWIRGR